MKITIRQSSPFRIDAELALNDSDLDAVQQYG